MQWYVSDVSTGFSRSLGAGLAFMVFVHAKIVGISSLPFFFPPSKCSLQTRDYSLTGVLTLLILTSHFVNKFSLCKGKR